MFGFFRRKKTPPATNEAPAASSEAPAASRAEPTPTGASVPDVTQPDAATVDAAAIETPAVDAPTVDARGLATPAAVESPAIATRTAPASADPAPRKSWLTRLSSGLSRTRGNISALFSTVRLDDSLYEELESALLAADAGVDATDWLMDKLRDTVRRERLTEVEQVRAALERLLTELLMPLERAIDIDRASPLVWLIAGVNGAGKTTSIGKIAHHLQAEGKTVLLAAGDTFRAAAREQLAEWGSRNGVTVIAQQGGDPAAVAFDAISAGRARGMGVVIIDTAGRLPTQQNLMEELRKIRRVTGKAMDGAPHEALLVLDGNTGQNMLAQIKAFDDAIGLTGLIVTKLDGTAKGGALAALAMTRRDRPVPVYFVGVGEKLQDLQAFSAAEFAQALVGG